jgi:predicted lipid-binding transport protein (Tim44 family)
MNGRRLVRLLPFVLLAFAGCGGGGGDADEARQALRDFVEATNERDGERLCDELLTQEYMEKSTGATGDRADEACRQQLELTTGLRIELLSIGRAEVDGERATVRAVLNSDGVSAPRLFRLEWEDGRWKLADGSSG